MLTTLVVLALILGTAGLAAAQNATKTTPVKKTSSKCAAKWKLDPKAVCKVEIGEAEEVETNRAIPNTTEMTGNNPTNMPTLIRLRTNFLDRIVASAEDL